MCVSLELHAHCSYDAFLIGQVSVVKAKCCSAVQQENLIIVAVSVLLSEALMHQETLLVLCPTHDKLRKHINLIFRFDFSLLVWLLFDFYC